MLSQLPHGIPVAPALGLLLLCGSGLVFAHGGEDHDHAPAAPAVVGSAPHRLADGSVFLPKAAQRQFGLRTLPAKFGSHAVTLELNGRVIADPRAGGKVQATQNGRLELGVKAVLGQRVARGEVLGRLQPLLSGPERGGQQEQAARLEAEIEAGQRRLARLEQLDGVVPAREIESARIELNGMQKRRAALAGGLGEELLRAPLAGVVAAVHGVSGQVVEARETLVEIVDPERLVVEALAYDPVVAAGLGGGSAALPGGELKLDWLGSGRVLREGALPVLFRVRAGAHPPLAVGQVLRLLARTRNTRQGVAVPVQAVLGDAAGATRVWLHVGAERFAPRAVRTAPLDAGSLLVLEGLAEGERVVENGAAALARVR